MRNLPLSLVVLASPTGMGVRMARERRSDSAESPADANARREMTRPRAEVEQLEAERARRG
ncbi:MAG: hypothetical protein ACRDQ4_20480 [Pseudonocardiaceae bacterium]